MNIYLKAGLRTILMFSCFSLCVTLGILYLSPEVLGYIGTGLILASLFYATFSINLNQLRYQEKLQDLNESIKNIKVDK